MKAEPNLHEAVGAYVLDALPPDERATFAAHMAACANCRKEAQQLMEAVVGLAEGGALPPDDGARSRLLDEIRRTKQETFPPRARRGHRLLPWALAACVAATAASGTTAWLQHEQARNAEHTALREQQSTAALAEVFTAPDATLRTSALSNGAQAGVVLSRQEGKTAFIASGLPALGQEKVYQLWYADNGVYRPAGLLAGSGGRQARILLGALGRATAVGITTEPAGGSRRPTSPPLAIVEL
ncbi:anti-sigma factor domain-containing protein [Streptomyces sp. NPDC051287]|uniref:anti-sigma factor n=1 Tax=Streptomyces sp. NPDC051287 TaxID=3365648 RepID=UPI0037B83CB7